MDYEEIPEEDFEPLDEFSETSAREFAKRLDNVIRRDIHERYWIHYLTQKGFRAYTINPIGTIIIYSN
jgi:hypothetical protein